MLIILRALRDARPNRRNDDWVTKSLNPDARAETAEPAQLVIDLNGSTSIREGVG
jgi:hypothetical protein